MYLLGKGYKLLRVENSAVKEYRENIYGSETETDDMDARLMARMVFYMSGWEKNFPFNQYKLRLRSSCTKLSRQVPSCMTSSIESILVLLSVLWRSPSTQPKS